MANLFHFLSLAVFCNLRPCNSAAPRKPNVTHMTVLPPWLHPGARVAIHCVFDLGRPPQQANMTAEPARDKWNILGYEDGKYVQKNITVEDNGTIVTCSIGHSQMNRTVIVRSDSWMTFLPKKSHVYAGDNIICRFTSAFYEMRWPIFLPLVTLYLNEKEKAKSVFGVVLKVTRDMAGRNRKWQCKVSIYNMDQQTEIRMLDIFDEPIADFSPKEGPVRSPVRCKANANLDGAWAIIQVNGKIKARRWEQAVYSFKSEAPRSGYIYGKFKITCMVVTKDHKYVFKKTKIMRVAHFRQISLRRPDTLWNTD